MKSVFVYSNLLRPTYHVAVGAANGRDLIDVAVFPRAQQALDFATKLNPDAVIVHIDNRHTNLQLHSA